MWTKRNKKLNCENKKLDYKNKIGQNGQELDKKWTIRIKVDKMDEMDKIGL